VPSAAAIQVDDVLAGLSGLDLAVLSARMQWLEKARLKQLTPDGDWYTWLILTGRGWGKTEVGANWTWWNAWMHPNSRWAVVAATSDDLRKTCFEGETGLIAVTPKEIIGDYNRQFHEIALKNGSLIQSYADTEPNRLRGPQHHGAWGDETAAWLNMEDTLANLRLGLRLGDKPQMVMTTTPKPSKTLRALAVRDSTIVTTGPTDENLENLPDEFRRELYDIYEGTRLGRQELGGEILDDAEGALWRRDWLDRDRRRVEDMPDLGAFAQIVVGIDPAATSTESSDETGIIVSAVDHIGHGWVLEDVSGRYTPEKWARAAIEAYHRWNANKVVAESNNGGDMVKSVLRAVDATVPIKLVTASRGKAARAEPIAAYFEQGRVHVVGTFRELEDQLCTWEPMGKMRSPDRLDALVWGLSEMMVRRRYGQAQPGVAVLGGMDQREEHYAA
jgi:phage terminase large subunit-like protein